jgi:hypothetical protein
VATESVRIRYRPLRLGWCVRKGNWDDLRSVLRSAHTLWGGVFNPILSIDDADHAAQLVRLYEVDVLFLAAEEPQLKFFRGRDGYTRGWCRGAELDRTLTRAIRLVGRSTVSVAQ